MNDYSLIDNNKEKTLSAIFQTDEDKNGVDILRMSNFFDIFIDDIDNNWILHIHGKESQTSVLYWGKFQLH